MMHLGNLSIIDWSIMIVAVVALRLVSLSTRHYMKGVSDFLSANRLAGRYLLTIAQNMGGTGVISFIAMFEVLYSRGLSPGWWSGFHTPVGLIILLTGWVYYRFRETRAMTMAQFLEMRYSRKLRIFAGILCWSSGIINFGIFPAVAARFFIYFCGLPDHFHIPGIDFAIPSIALVMLIDLAFAISFVNMGGQISVMVTDCVQGMFCSFAFIVVAATILIKVSWPEMMQALSMAPKDQSMINPFHTSAVNDFNIWYYLIAVFGGFFSHLSWQGAQGFNCSARNPHEQKMGGIIGVWRNIPQGIAITTAALAAVAIMRLPQFADQAHIVSATLAKIPNESVQDQMRVPIVMAHILPIAVKGLLGTIFLFFSFTCHDTYMHSWGSIFIQDIYMPIKNKVLSPEEHIKLLRWSILGVAAFAFVFSLLYQPSEKILFFFAITGTIWLGGSGAVIIGGLYWRRGTTPAAFSALVVGAVVGVGGLILPKVYLAQTGHAFPINNQWLWFMAMICSSLVYVTVSLITGRNKEPYNLERMLHRGNYRVQADHVVEHEQRSRWSMIVGITKEFSTFDKVLAIVLVCWNMMWFSWFVIFSIINLLHPVSDSMWMSYEYLRIIIIPSILCLPMTVWFTVGGIHDIRHLFAALKAEVRDNSDDGSFHGYKDDQVSEVGLSADSECTLESSLTKQTDADGGSNSA
ncbi:sodium:solute symporter [bacterium]|nr:sodium:solute symporter [bacterium]